MIADLHSHYPTHLVPSGERDTLGAISRPGREPRFGDRVRSFLIRLASRFANYRSFDSGPRVTMEELREGNVGVVLSVLLSPLDEFDFGDGYPGPPEDDYFDRVMRKLADVERDIAQNHAGVATIAHDPGELDAAISDGKTVLIHCVEGGFHVGHTEEAITRNVGELARSGVGYITVAHLIWREIATNANAIPFLRRRLYDWLFPQPKIGLAPLGRALIRAMVEERVLIDLSHMSSRALSDTFDLLDELDPGREVPVIATHSGARFGRQAYNLDDSTIRRIADRNGVIGLILAEHQMTDGLAGPLRRRGRRTRSFEESMDTLSRHIDHIREVTGSSEHVGIGSDLDGFIKPTLSGLEDASELGRLEEALRSRYGDPDAALISSGNALRVLRAGWGPSA